MNFQYLEDFDLDSLHFNLHSTEKVMNLEQKEIKQRENLKRRNFIKKPVKKG